MPTYFIYPIYTAILMLIVLAVVPRKQIKKLALYGIIFGALGVLFNVLVFTKLMVFLKLIGVGEYLNIVPFGFMGIPFFPPLAWVAYFILFFYFLPAKRPWNYIYVLTAAGYSTLFSNVLVNLTIFKWNYGNLIIPYLLFLSWFSLATWYFLNDTRKEKVNEKLITSINKSPSTWILRNPAWKLDPNFKKK